MTILLCIAILETLVALVLIRLFFKYHDMHCRLDHHFSAVESRVALLERRFDDLSRTTIMEIKTHISEIERTHLGLPANKVIPKQ